MRTARPAFGALAGAMAGAYSGTGFAYVTGHGIPARVIDALFDASRRFHALPRSAKAAIAVNRHHRGYIAPETATDRASSVEAATRPNLSESFIKLSDPPPGRKAWPLDGPNRWPGLPGFRDAVEAFEAAAEPVAAAGWCRRWPWAWAPTRSGCSLCSIRRRSGCACCAIRAARPPRRPTSTAARRIPISAA